ncbi:hypothetical protein EK21DRAFT_90154 [Setomelanomma holmii]|uniref:Uncharacterized protein n=1 Tax=Setomelanomma holmii TaxID=210430 RepID=A0A9P4LLY0_9PLEO|nr:hypothetical protein EK21DRAFT_90154 [Setomelanomma holmii]
MRKKSHHKKRTAPNSTGTARPIRRQVRHCPDHNTKLIDKVAELKARVDDLAAVSAGARSWASVAAASTPTGLNATPRSSASHQHFNGTSPSSSDAPNVTVDISRADSENGRIEPSKLAMPGRDRRPLDPKPDQDRMQERRRAPASQESSRKDWVRLAGAAR